MDDPFLVCFFERFDDLPCDVQRFIAGDGAVGESIRERRPFHELENEDI